MSIKILITIIVISVLYQIGQYLRKYDSTTLVKEGFTQKKKFVEKNNEDLFDPFYTGVYDDLLYNETKNYYEINQIMKLTNMSDKSVVLDIGCGTGHHVSLLKKEGVPNVIGIDRSLSMIKQAQENDPNCKFEHMDALKAMSYKPNSFSDILCLYFTIYYIKDKMTFFKNCYSWLKPGGFLVIHLVNRDMFDPIVPAADPLFLVSPQKYAKKRITNSNIKFIDFQYKAKFNLEKSKNQATFEETFKDDKTGNIRKNTHTLYMEPQKEILSLAANNGFIFKGKIDLLHVQYEYQYLYILYKPPSNAAFNFIPYSADYPESLKS